MLQISTEIKVIGAACRYRDPYAGVRIAIAARSAYDLYLSRNLQHAELVRAEGIDGSFELFVGEGLDVLAGLRPRLLTDVTQIENARILDGRFTAVQHAVPQ